MEQLSFLLEREMIIGLGIFGAIVATVGNFLLRAKSSFPKQQARYVMLFGYGLTWISIGLFIIAGFATAYAAPTR
jgi:hypothetical protein